MSLYYIVNHHTFAPALPTAYITQPQLTPITNIFFLPHQVPFFPNLNLTLQHPTISPPSSQAIPTVITEGIQRSELAEQLLKSRKTKRRRRRTLQKERQSAKKNSESNLINQLLSFFSNPQKSSALVDRAIKQLGKDEPQIQNIRTTFYTILRLINYKRGRKYVNKLTLMHFYTPRSLLAHLPDATQGLLEPAGLKLSELCHLFRVVTFHFIRIVSPLAILSSRRISTVARREHLKRRRGLMVDLQRCME